MRQKSTAAGRGHVRYLIVFMLFAATTVNYADRASLSIVGPAMPPGGYHGVPRVLGTVEGLKKFVGIQESAYHGVAFCQGTISEDLADPGQQIYDVIRWFGERK